jgi:hypothetical protein
VSLVASRDDFERQWPAVANRPVGEREARCSRLALVNGYYERLAIWDSAGNSWPVIATADPPIGAFARFLAWTVYNPVATVKVAFGEPRRFELEELKAELHELIGRDDDVLTQFVSHDRLRKLVDLAESPGRLIRVLAKHQVI